MNKWFFSILMFFMVSSCSDDNQTFQGETRIGWDDFVSKNIEGRVLSFDEIIEKPYQLMIKDSILITLNSNADSICHVFNLNTMKKIGEAISVGQGPHEMLHASFVFENSDSIKLYDMMKSNIYSYSLEGLLSNQPPSSIIKLSESYMFSELAALKNGYACSSYRPDFPCYLFDKSGKKTAEGLGNYPVCSEEYTDLEVIDAYRAVLIGNNLNRVAVCHYFTDLIDIYDFDKGLVKRLHGPEHFYTRFNEFSEGNRIGSSPDKAYYRDAFYSPINAGECFFVLFNGKFVTDPEYNLMAKDILTFNWDGNPLMHYRLNIGVESITVVPEKRKIYGISQNPEYQIVEYSY